MRLFAAASIVLALLSGCAAVGDAGPKLPEMRCRAAGAQAYLGQQFDERVEAEARAAAGGLRTRVTRAGAPAAADVDPLRLNIELDESNRIHRMVCG